MGMRALRFLVLLAAVPALCEVWLSLTSRRVGSGQVDEVVPPRAAAAALTRRAKVPPASIPSADLANYRLPLPSRNLHLDRTLDLFYRSCIKGTSTLRLWCIPHARPPRYIQGHQNGCSVFFQSLLSF
ncbi:hypothetical protein IWX90DRAFT_418365 [Phyllosticta citrichinensis]|uniref:Uncharacterized protein n=1 Tax=Phyllosticta citrichinensis TaxID=1130410 RepID=A0ABR1XIJ3_9PEZI